MENAVGLPEAEELVIDGLTIEEWQGLQDSLAQVLTLSAVALDAMVVSALLHPSRDHPKAMEYRALVGCRDVVVSFAVVTEPRFGAFESWLGRTSARTR